MEPGDHWPQMWQGQADASGWSNASTWQRSNPGISWRTRSILNQKITVVVGSLLENPVRVEDGFCEESFGGLFFFLNLYGIFEYFPSNSSDTERHGKPLISKLGNFHPNSLKFEV